MLEKHIAQGTGGETAKLHSQINSAKKVRIKSEAKLKQRVQDMHKYTDVYRSGMEVEFQRCQEEEHGEDAATNGRTNKWHWSKVIGRERRRHRRVPPARRNAAHPLPRLLPSPARITFFRETLMEFHRRMEIVSDVQRAHERLLGGVRPASGRTARRK